MENVTKRFGKVVANNAINLELHEGEILSLLGENGSGKTTLMNMLSGIYFPDEGQIYIHGEPVTIASPKDAFEHGIGMIHQHFKLVDLFTATENIILGLEGKLDIAEASKKVKEICDKYGFDIDPNQKIYDMSVSQKQTVEIVKVLYRGADILILDEPTAVLTPQETDKLFAIMRNMKADGKSLIIITHKLHEVLDVSDRVAVLRKGEYVGDVATKDADQQSLTDSEVPSIALSATSAYFSKSLNVGGWFGQVFLSYGFLAYLAIVIALFASYLLKHTRTGLHLRAVGESAATADAAGINVTKYKYLATCIGSMIAGLGGLYYVMDYACGVWSNNAFGDRGWLAIALVIFTIWRPNVSVLASILFGGFYILYIFIPTGTNLAIKELYKMLPYVVTLVVLIIVSLRKKREDQPPASLGLSYFREER